MNNWLSAEVNSHLGGSGAFPLNAKRNMVAQPPHQPAATGHECTVAPIGDCGESGNVGVSALWRLYPVVHAEDSICQKSMDIGYPRFGSKCVPAVDSSIVRL